MKNEERFCWRRSRNFEIIFSIVDSANDRDPEGPTFDGQFRTTQWTVVVKAGQIDTEQAREALEKLCRTYWLPLYVYVRRRGYTPEDAKDLTQEFFWQLLSKNYLDQAKREKGRFRSFLLASMTHFLSNEWDRMRAQKRGGLCERVPWQEVDWESQYQPQVLPELSADRSYERQWALTLVNQVLQKLREEWSGKERMFDLISAFLSGERPTTSYIQVASQLEMNPGTIQVAVHRLRRRYGELLRSAVAQTVKTPEEIDDEIRRLLLILSGCDREE
jgi:RNA polymerase sigma factor (sigma-70 family)